jgi:hypothetical protein
LSGNILGDRIQNGTTTIDIQTPSGNANITIGGTGNVAVFTTTGAFITGVTSVSGNITGGNVLTGGLISATGNITGGNILGGANVNATTHTGTTVSVTGNITGGNILGGANVNATTHTGTTVSVTGNITGGNVSGTSIVGTLTTAAQTNITSVGTLSSLTVTANVAGGNLTTAGQVVATGNVNGGNLVVTGNLIDSAALEIITGSNGNITLSPNGTGLIVANKDIRNGQANGVGNIGTVGGFFNTIFAKSTSAQYADLAEMYVSDADYPAGTVVEFGGEYEITISSASHSTCVVGIISTNPSYLMNSAQTGEHVLPVALTGRVPCQVQGPVRKGDVLVASAIPGVAQRIGMNWQPGCILGKSMQVIDSAEIRTIEVAVGRT